MRARSVLLLGLIVVAGTDSGISSAADRIDLFLKIEATASEMPPDSLAVYESELNIAGLAGMT